MFEKEKVKDLRYNINGFLSAADIQKASDEILEKYGKDATMPGFRKGHVPLDVLRKKFGKNAMAEAADKLMNKDLSDFVADKKIRIANNPKVDVPEFKEDSDLEYTIEFDILPELPEIDLAKFTLTQKTADLDESEVEKALENLRKSRAQAEKQDENYKAVNGDVAVIDFKGFVGDVAFEGGEASKHHLVLGSNSFIPGFEEQVIGHKAGDKFDVNVKFPKEYHAPNLADKDAKFEINLHEVRKHVLPELNEELAKSVGQESVESLKEHIRKILNDQYTEASKASMRDELLEILADKVKLNLPESLVEQEFEMAKKQFDSHSGHAHAKDAKFDDKKETKDAGRRVKLGLILAEWGSKNKVEVTNEDLQAAIWNEAARYPDPQQVFEYYNKNQHALSMLRGMLFEKKSLDAMLELVKTKEKKVKAEELFTQAQPK